MRFAVDSLLLPSFAAESLRQKPLRLKNPLRKDAFGIQGGGLACADLGVGCGASALALLLLVPNVKVWGVDIAAELAESARQNAAAMKLSHRARFEVLDVACLADVQRPFCDVVQMNPPYWEEGAGLASPKALVNCARRSQGAVKDFLRAARKLLVHHGRLFIVFPAARMVPLLEEAGRCGFGVRRLRAVRPFAGSKAGRVLVEAVKDARHETDWAADVVLYSRTEEGKSVPTREAKAFCPWLK